MAAAALVVDCPGPPQRPRDLGACEVDAVEAALLDDMVEDGLAVALGRAREAAEVAAAPRVAVAELEVGAGNAPVGHGLIMDPGASRGHPSAVGSRTRRPRPNPAWPRGARSPPCADTSHCRPDG